MRIARKTLVLALAFSSVGMYGQKTMLESNLMNHGTLEVEGASVDNAAYLHDGDDTSVATFTGNGTDVISLICKFDKAVTVTGINIVAGEDLDKAPSQLMVYGRDTGDSEWKSLGRSIAFNYDLPYTNAVGRTKSTKEFAQYKIEMTKTTAGGGTAQIAELQLFGYDSDTRVLSTPDAGSYAIKEGAVDYVGYKDEIELKKENYDNGVMDENAWRTWIQYDFDTPQAIDGYSVGGVNMSYRPNRPSAWELLASNDGEEWVTIDMRSNGPDVMCENFAVEYVPGKSVNIDFAKVADKILLMVDKKFYKSWGNGYYLIDTWNQDESKCNFSYNYWWMAHAIDAYTDAYRRSGKRSYQTNAKGILNGMYIAYDAGRRDLWNSYYDDMEWMCLAALRAYEVFGADSWLDEAKQLFEWIWEGWDDTTGGILWNNGSQRGVVDSKNSCSNGPALIAAAMLYQTTGDAKYLEKANKIFDFMYEHNLFDDGFVKDAPANNNRGWTFTYNQGTWVGGLLELYRITKDTKYYDIAVDLMDKSMDSRWYSPRGVMGESGKGDGGMFKGIYVRYITEWVRSGLLDEERQVRYATYLVENARSLYSAALLKPDMTIMANWQDRGEAKLNEYCSSVVLSGLFLIEAVDRLRREGILNDDYSVKNPNVGNAFKHYRLNVTANFNANTVQVGSFALLGNEVSGIESVKIEDGAIEDEDDRWFNLNGIQVSEPSVPGIYIKNGKKFIVK